MKSKKYQWGAAILVTFIAALLLFPPDSLAASDDFDVAKGWDVEEYTSDLNIPLDKVFIEDSGAKRDIGNGEEKINRAFLNFANIGNSKFRAVKTLPLKHGVTYKFKWRFGMVTTGKATAAVDFNGKTFTSSKEPWDVYEYTITPTADMDYKITMSFVAPKITNVFLMVGYDIDPDGSKGIKIIQKGKPVTAHYVNEDNQKIADSEVIEGNIGDAYTCMARAIPNYKLKEVAGKDKGKITETTQTVRYIYEPVKEEKKTAGKVTIKYVDEQGKQVAADKILTGKINTAFQAEIKAVPGYIATHISSSMGIFQTEDQIIKVVYKAVKPTENSNVIVKFLDKQGKEIAVPVILTGKLGAEYKAQPKELKGYRVTGIPKNQTGIFTKDTQSVIYQYEKESKKDNEKDPKKPDPDKHESNGNGQSGKKPIKRTDISTNTIGESKQPAKKPVKQDSSHLLPSTGDSTWDLFLFIGLVVMGTGLITWKKKIRDEKGE